MICPQAVIFDLGKVLIEFDYGIAVRRLISHCSVRLDILQQLVQLSPLLYEYEAGGVTTDQFFQRIKAATGFRGDLAEFHQLFCDIFTPIPAMVELHAALCQRGVPTYVFSNTNELAVQFIRDRFPFFRRFQGYIFSYEHRALKPDARLYEVVEQVAGCRGSAFFYVDDRPENVAAGQARGWQAILHENAETTGKALRAVDLLD